MLLFISKIDPISLKASVSEAAANTVRVA
jgi:hypothetical protein